ncbi:MAG: response regulator [Xanthobacteraceae bacterium]|nr:MAG: response regulator [Xanthobacteraceae bacterium]
MGPKPRATRAGRRPRASPTKRPVKKTAKAKTAKALAGAASTPRVVEAALATFAHEVRTPLTGILAISELLATSGLGERERHWVETIKASAEHLAALATLFVDAAKGRAVGVGLRRDFFDLHALARAAGDSLTGRAAARGLTARVEIAKGLSVYVLGDAVRLRAALENLIDNAVKFTGQGDVALKATVARSARGRFGASFAVSDSGIGISMAEVKRLFRPFSQANVTIARRFGGAGLGLASVRALARAMGGDVTVTARRGGGTTFTLTVQLDRATRQDAALLGVAPDLTPRATRPLRILCVEDNPFGRVILNTILTELGHHAEFIGRGETVGERVAEGDIEVVLMDMVLPGINGIETIRRIRALGPPRGNVAIIGLSGRGEDEEAARAAGANAFLVKPVSPRALAMLLAEIGARLPSIRA